MAGTTELFCNVDLMAMDHFAIFRQSRHNKKRLVKPHGHTDGPYSCMSDDGRSLSKVIVILVLGHLRNMIHMPRPIERVTDLSHNRLID